MVTVTSNKMHLSNMPCPELLKMMSHYNESIKDFWVQKTSVVYSILLLFSELFAAAVKMEKIEMSTIYIIRIISYLLLCMSGKGCYSYVTFCV